MTIPQSVKDLSEENQRLESLLLRNSEEISFELFSEWRSNQQKIGKSLAEEALYCIAKKYNAYILSNPVNPASYASFIRSDVQSKAFYVKERTLREGMLSGFLQSGSSHFKTKPLNFWIQKQQFYAVLRGGKECLVKEISPSDRSIEASCYEDNLFIISDIDLIFILLQENSDKNLTDLVYGEVSAQELTIIQEVNRCFQALVSQYFVAENSSLFRLIAHGPANRFSNSKASHIHYPLKVYSPLGRAISLDSTQEFSDFNRNMEFLGYHVHLNSKWGILK